MIGGRKLQNGVDASHVVERVIALGQTTVGEDIFDLAHSYHLFPAFFDNIENRQPYAVLYTSLGCPFRCEFCCINPFC